MHRANDRNTREEVNTAIEKLKAKHPTDPLSVDDSAFISSLRTELDQADNVD